ncbi:hypothetical protein [Clostridium fallax]|uniref:Uncharacterized protein n=1 Tax=Clostridium fallax TaxID=1533 RepID=A0A1M4XY51_9CLOT|nr:hypothetical protein [Clostridium fallax]SHE98369.1 hypothetical protein SAMN05443638_12210 [Clostridium fallax]SQB06477.1 Uncharacterised protein [Clostridium fallax]
MSNKEDNNDNYFEDYKKALDIDLADGEILGSTFLVAGYLKFIKAANVDKEKTYGEDIGDNLEPAEILYYGERIILEGLCILAVIAIKRLEEKRNENIISDSKEPIKPYEDIVNGYIASVLANMVRVDALRKICQFNKNEETFL